MRAIIAELTVDDVDAAVYWYRDLGFAVELEGLRDEDGLQWVSLVHEGRSVWLLRADMAPFDGDHARPCTQADVDALYSRVIDRGLQVETVPAAVVRPARVCPARSGWIPVGSQPADPRRHTRLRLARCGLYHRKIGGGSAVWLAEIYNTRRH